jgi:hypothetical protein
MRIAHRTFWATGLLLVLSSLLHSALHAADVDVQALNYGARPSLPAVDGLNATATAFGGAADGRALYGGAGSVTVPLGFRYGLQVDGLVAGFDNQFQGNVTTSAAAGHLFWRDPAVGLLGAYGHYIRADAFSGVNVYAGAGEGALYLGRFALEVIAGVQGGTVDVGALGRLHIDTRFFDVSLVSYYPTDNLKLSVGHTYILGRNAALFVAEWGFPTAAGTMPALFASGSVSEGGVGAILAGLRFYFGRREKTLIRRHREDDPSGVGSPGFLSGNVIQVPTYFSVNICGNTTNTTSSLSPAFGNAC